MRVDWPCGQTIDENDDESASNSECNHICCEQAALSLKQIDFLPLASQNRLLPVMLTIAGITRKRSVVPTLRVNAMTIAPPPALDTLPATLRAKNAMTFDIGLVALAPSALHPAHDS